MKFITTILRIFLGFTTKISICSVNNAVLEAFVLQLLFLCIRVDLLFSSNRFYTSRSAVMLNVFIKWYCGKLFLLAGQPSALSVVALHENQRLKVQSACSDVSSEDYSKCVKYYISFGYCQNICLGINKTLLFVTLKCLPAPGHLQEKKLTNFKENSAVWHQLVIHIIYDLHGNILKL
jgi:hypothetical protein